MCKPDSKNSIGGNADAAKPLSKSETISPDVPSGLERRKIPIVTSMMGLVFVLKFVEWYLKDTTTWLRPADEFCKEDAYIDADGRCSRPDLFAGQVASGIAQVYIGGMGLYTWHIAKRTKTGLPQTPEGRLFGYLEEADQLLVGILVYQTYDFFHSMFVPEFCTPIFMGHHLVAALTALMSLKYQMVHYYAVFFGGCSEISTVFLVLCDFNVYFPAEDRGSTWGIIITICQVGFVLCFLYYRIIAWIQVSYNLWSDILTARNKGAIEDFRPKTGWFLYWFLFSDVSLGALQLYWFFFGIVPEILAILG